MLNKRATTTVLLVVASAWTTPVYAQQWNDSRVLELVQHATDRRVLQLADSGLADYRAVAHGYLTFLAQLGEGFREPPQVVKADELALQVYWRAPNLSKQVIVGRRDTTLLPTDIAYHRDHLGIVQNNFPAVIRLGEGDEVRDVPHPLSPMGAGLYDFALSDSLRIQIPGRSINVYEVKVRPKDDKQARFIGAVYIDRDNAQVVRMAFSFTRAAFIDTQLEDVFIVLENGLVGTRFWLPRHQEIEIRRTATWMDYPVRGIIRGRWEISEYDINIGIALGEFAGPEIVMLPREEQAKFAWPNARILDSLPSDVRVTTAEEIRRVQAETRSLVRAQALRRKSRAALSLSGVSDVARFNRVEGTSLGAGRSLPIGGGVSLNVSGRYGFDDHHWKGKAELQWQSGRGESIGAYARRDLDDIGFVAERSGLVNSVAAQEFASDYTDLFSVDAVGAGVTVPRGNWTWMLDMHQERQASATVHAAAATGTFRPAPVIRETNRFRASLRAERRSALGWWGLETRSRVQSWSNPVRLTFDVESSRPLGGVKLTLRTLGGVYESWWRSDLAAGMSGVFDQDRIVFGGPVTAPGYSVHSFAGDAGASQRIELQMPVPFWAISLGRFGRSPASVTVAPFVSALGIHGSTQPDGIYGSAGVGVLYFFDLIRFDVARGLRNGRWIFSVDANRLFWSVL